MLAIIPPSISDLPTAWQKRAAERRQLSPVDPAADAMVVLAKELAEKIEAAKTASRTLTTAEYATIRKVAPGTVRKWCARGQLPGATQNDAGDWMIPATAVRVRARRTKP